MVGIPLLAENRTALLHAVSKFALNCYCIHIPKNVTSEKYFHCGRFYSSSVYHFIETT